MPSDRSIPPIATWWTLLKSTILDRPISRQVAWVVGPFAAMQLLRLISNIVLTHILAPQLFGLMLLVNSLRTGAELLSDIGIGQSVVRSRNGENRTFLDVAWTIQVFRGLLLTGIMLALAWPISELYDKPELFPILLVVSPIFILTGLQSPALFTIQKRIDLRKRAAYDLFGLVANIAMTVTLALVLRSIWALVFGLLFTTLFSTILSHLLSEKYMPRFRWQPDFVLEIVHFGKWIFLSTAIFFAAGTFDRLYFVGSVPIALAGVYAVARTFSDMLSQLAQRAGSFLVFPKVAAMQDRRDEIGDRLRSMRMLTLSLVACAAGVAVACSDKFILLAYDPRYHAAAFMIPILLSSVWFGILSSFADSMLMGCGRPAPGAWANGGKFVALLIGLPLAVMHGDFLVAMLVLMLAEMIRWVMLIPPSRREKLTSFKDDVMLTGLMFGTAVIIKSALGSFGIVPGIAQWWSMHGLLHT